MEQGLNDAKIFGAVTGLEIVNLSLPYLCSYSWRRIYEHFLLWADFIYFRSLAIISLLTVHFYFSKKKKNKSDNYWVCRQLSTCGRSNHRCLLGFGFVVFSHQFWPSAAHPSIVYFCVCVSVYMSWCHPCVWVFVSVCGSLNASVCVCVCIHIRARWTEVTTLLSVPLASDEAKACSLTHIHWRITSAAKPPPASKVVAVALWREAGAVWGWTWTHLMHLSRLNRIVFCGIGHAHSPSGWQF